MSTIYMTWEQLKNKHQIESIELKYYYTRLNLNIYLLKDHDVYISIITRDDMVDRMVISSSDKTQAQSNCVDFCDNHKGDSEETIGVEL